MVVNPTNTTHEIRLIPRSKEIGALSLSIVNEFTDTQSDIDNTFFLENGYLFITFDFTFSERSNYKVTVSSDGVVVFRGNIFATNQVPQDFKLSEGVYL